MKTTVNDVEIAYRDEGTGLPLIFLHAFPMNQRMWDEQLEALKPHCRVITLDLRGFGESQSPNSSYSLEDMASDVRALMKHLSVDRAVIAGLSMGGYIAMAFYRNYPDAVRALVLSDTRTVSDTDEGRSRRFLSAQKAAQEGPAAIARDMVPVLLGPTSLKERPDVVERVTRIAESNPSRGIAAAQRAMAGRPDSTSLMSEARIPVLLIRGSEDALSPPSEMEAMQKNIPAATLKIIDRAGHLSNLEQPDLFNAALLEFVTALN